MLKCKNKKGDILLGIDADNVKALKEGNPIHIMGSELNLTHDIMIVYGDTLQDVADLLGMGELGEPPKPTVN